MSQTTNAFDESRIGQIINDLAHSPEVEAQANVETKPDKEQVNTMVLEFRALIARMGVLPDLDLSTVPSVELDADIVDLLDRDLIDEIHRGQAPDVTKVQERRQTEKRLQELLRHPEVLDQYRKVYGLIRKEIDTVRKLVEIYENRPLEQDQRLAVARQAIRILNNLIRWCDEEQLNIFNQVSRERRGYRKSDHDILAKLKKYKARAKAQLEEIRDSDPEIKIQERIDEIRLNRQILSRSLSRDTLGRREGQINKNYLATPSRMKILLGEETSAANSIVAALRERNNVELTGPTGTGKTNLAEYAALMFSGKEPIVVSCTHQTNIYTFLGSASDLGKRNEGALIKCLKEGRVLILDEDNRADPKALAVLKRVLGLKPGSIFTHPDTGEEIVVPPTFGIIASRNEVGKHHKDRFQLTPDYRREFVDGSFEVGYFPKEELYYDFLIPKLCNEDGSMSLSEEEVGGSLLDTGQRSPLVSLVIAAEKIQKIYQEGTILEGVFESGFLVDFFKRWHQERARTGCTFLQFIETRLLEFVKRPIGNAARIEIIKILVEEGFFSGADEDTFKTLNDGVSIKNADLQALRSVSVNPKRPIFSSPMGRTLDARSVAALDPFGIKSLDMQAEHPHEEKINEMKKIYKEYSRLLGERSLPINGKNLDKMRPRILTKLSNYVANSTLFANKKMIESFLRKAQTGDDEAFLSNVINSLHIIVARLVSAEATS